MREAFLYVSTSEAGRFRVYFISAEELELFLQGNQPANRQKEPAGPSKEHDTSGIENDLLSVHLSSEKQQNLIQMINDGASDEELMNLIN